MDRDIQIPTIDKITGFSPFDIHFSRFIAGLDSEAAPEVKLAAAILSRVVRSGDSCLDLEKSADRPIGGETDHERAPALVKWVSALLSSDAVGRPGQRCPLILDSQNRLYLYRYWQYERRLADAILKRVSRPLSEVRSIEFKHALDRYFPASTGNGFDWQKFAAVMVLSKYFCVITGGPGTGKTFTIARMLALYCALNQGTAPRIHLAAPTGKAAAQLKSSVFEAKSRMEIPAAIERCIPDEVFTLHRLLRVQRGSSDFYYNAKNQLPTDILIVDEASMVDLALMSRLVAALPDDARLILAGDRDQLASVEAGSVLGDICGQLNGHKYSRQLNRFHHQVSGEPLPQAAVNEDAACGPMGDAIAVLHHNHRFDSDSGLGALSQAVRAGKTADAFDLLIDPGERDLQWIDYQMQDDVSGQLSSALLKGFKGYLESQNAMSALNAMQQFQILTALRRGPHGADGINLLAETVLARNRLIRPETSSGGRSYHGRPVIITHNDYDMQLFNGDIGVIWKDEEGRGDQLSAFFTAADGSYRKIWLHRLPAHETVFAMTVHKSQGSEFNHVMLFLPPQDNELLTCELIYTALTRARRKVTVWAPQAVLKKALQRRLARSSGLRDALWSVSGPEGHH